jgi:uncharacterized protein DUF4156
MRRAILAALALTTGCTYAELSARGREVRIADATPAGCENLGIVIGEGGGGGGEFVPTESLVEHAMNDARNKAAERGATHVTLSPPALGGGKHGTSSATLTGFAYRCAEGARAPDGTTAVPR